MRLRAESIGWGTMSWRDDNRRGWTPVASMRGTCVRAMRTPLTISTSLSSPMSRSMTNRKGLARYAERLTQLVEARDTGTHRGSFLGVDATGVHVTHRELAVYELVAGRIGEVWTTAHNLALLAQLRA